jgi:hypothetical protein
MTDTPSGSPAPDFDISINAEIDELIEEFGGKPDATDFANMATKLEAEIEKHNGANFDPPDPAYWREVAAGLRERGTMIAPEPPDLNQPKLFG